MDAKTGAAWPPEASYVREFGWATTWKWLGFLSKNHLQRWCSFLAEWLNNGINKICVIGQIAIRTYSMSHYCITKKLRFCAVYGPAASLSRTSSVMIKTGMFLWMGINDNRMFLAPIGWYGPTGRRHNPHSECHNQFIGNQVWRTVYVQWKWSSRLAASVVRFDTVRLFPAGYVKSMVCATIDELGTNIKSEIAAVSADLCLKVIKNWVQCMDLREFRVSNVVLQQ